MKKILFILTILCLWKPAAYSAGFPSLLPLPQKIEWKNEHFTTKEISLFLQGNTEAYAPLQKNSISKDILLLM